jgi:hypothetical protein
MYLGPGGPASSHVALDKGFTLCMEFLSLFIDQRHTLCLLCIMNALDESIMCYGTLD